MDRAIKTTNYDSASQTPNAVPGDLGLRDWDRKVPTTGPEVHANKGQTNEGTNRPTDDIPFRARGSPWAWPRKVEDPVDPDLVNVP